ncbi:hypothetical protein ACFL54_00705 [Planctomycetota bacterium]
MLSLRLLLRHIFSIWQKRFTLLVPFNLGLACLAVYFMGIQGILRLEGLGISIAGQLLVIWLMCTILPLFAGQFRAIHIFFHAEDNVLILTSPVRAKDFFLMRLVQLYAWNSTWWLLSVALCLAAYNTLPPGQHHLAVWLSSLVLIYLTLPGFQLLKAFCLVHFHFGTGGSRKIIQLVLGFAFSLAVLVIIMNVLFRHGHALDQWIAGTLSPWLLALVSLTPKTFTIWAACPIVAVIIISLCGLLFYLWFERDHSKLQSFNRSRQTFLWNWNEYAHGILPRRVRTLLFRDLAVFLRSGFPRGILICSAMLIVPMIFAFDISSPQDPKTPVFLLEVKIYCYALFTLAAVAYCLGFDFLKTRVFYLGFDWALPQTPRDFWWGHFSFINIVLLPYTVIFILLVFICRDNIPELSAPWIAVRLLLLTGIIALHTCAFALGELKGREIKPESSFAISVAIIGIGCALLLPNWSFAVPLLALFHGKMIRKALLRLEQIEVTW